MPDIRDYPELDELENWILDNWDALEAEMMASQDVPQSTVELIDLEEIIIFGEYGRGSNRTGKFPLKLGFVISVEGEKTSESDLFNLAEFIATGFEEENIENEVPDYTPPTELMEESFNRIETNTIADDIRIGGINILMGVTEPQRAYSLTNDENILATEGAITTEQTDSRKLEDAENNAIIQYPQLPQLESDIESAYQSALDKFVEEQPQNEDTARNTEIANIIVTDEWGDAEAEFGVDSLEVGIFIDTKDDTNPNIIPRFNRLVRRLGEITSDEYQASELSQEWFSDVNIDGFSIEQFDSVIISNIENPEIGQVYSITDDTYYILEQTETGRFEVVPEDIQDEERRDAEAIEEAQEEVQAEGLELATIPSENVFDFITEGLQPRFEELAEEVSRSREEILMEKYPEIPPPLLPFTQEDDGSLEVPVGQKNTRRIEPREIYDFEIEMTEKIGDEQLEMEDFEPATDTQTFRDTLPEVGRAVRMDFENQPAASFPRTGIYIRNRLVNEGPAFILQLYRDLVFYSGFVRTKYNLDVRPGRLKSFRQMIYRLNDLPERGGPRLIEQLSQQQAAARGLKTVPSLPNGTEAPWLERRQYYRIVEENKDSDAWRNITGYIYG